MGGCAAKSSQFFYYACNNYSKRGKDICDTKLISKEKLEDFIIERVKSHILTEENLIELVRLTNEEIGKDKDEYQKRLAEIDTQLEDLKKRLHKLYNALETGKLEVEDLAPRIKEIKAQVDVQERNRRELIEGIQDAKIGMLKASAVKAYVEDLRSLLSKGSIVEQKSFLRSFVKRIEVKLPNITIDYTIPLETKKVEPLNREVLPMNVKFGWI